MNGKTVRIRKWGLLVLSIVLVMLVAPGVSQAVTFNGGGVIAVTVDPHIYVALEEKGRADILVILADQADLSGARQLTAKAEKGQYIYDRLISTAQRTQEPLREFLISQGIAFRSYWIQNMFRVSADLQLLEKLARFPGVDRIEMYYEPYLDVMRNDLGPEYPPLLGPSLPTLQIDQPDVVEWNIQRVGAPNAWGLGITGSGAVVGGLDSGVQYDHPALVNQYRGNLGGGTFDHNYNWWDGSSGSPTPMDYDGHGTHTMGTIVGDDGGTNQIGVAPGAKWIACAGVGSPTVDPFGCFEFFLAPTDLNGQNPRFDLAPHVISNSWSSAGTNYHPAILALYEAGIFYSKSAGNTGPACSTITNPGQWPEVTATAAFAQGDTIASFSSRGPVYLGYDPSVKPDIAAPGVNVRSSYPTNAYSSLQGTSMACPHVTGAVALLIDANPELAGKIDILQMLLKQSAEPKISAQCEPFVDIPNDVWGWGILDVFSAVQTAQAISLGAIQGTVLDTSMMLITDTLIAFTDETTGWMLYDTSDSAAQYERTLPAASYTISATHYGYLPGVESGVIIPEGVTVTQDLILEPAPLWNVTGTVSESQTGDPLEASIIFEDTPVSTQSLLPNGIYQAEVAQGTWWMSIFSPGHTRTARKVEVNQDRTEDFVLEAIQNYYMRTSEDETCGQDFSWLDATSGTPRNLSDDSYAYVNLPTGRTFTFYGNTYNGLYVVSNGFITFGSPNTSWSGPIPNPAVPNNAIYAFSTDLNPANGTQGVVYTQYIDNRYFIVEWHQVQHYPSGSPETFEIILDLDTGNVIIQYQGVSDPSGVVSGVENSTGTEATQYAYNDPLLLADSKAVKFYPIFGTPPPMGGQGQIQGFVTDAFTIDPIPDAAVVAVSYSEGEVFTFTTDVNGYYSGNLCADWYDVTAQAMNYQPFPDVRISIPSAVVITQEFALTPFPVAIITPTQISVDLAPNQSASETLTIEAGSGAPLTYTISELPSVEWLSEDPISGTITPMQSQVITVTFNSADLLPGYYTTTLDVKTNDPLQPSVTIPVTLTVSCVPVEADFVWQPEDPLAGEVITFTGTGIGTDPIWFSWDFGDGTFGEQYLITHTYEMANDYTVIMTATNCAMIPFVVTHTVSVSPGCTPVYDVDFTWDPITPTVGDEVNFSASAFGTEPLTYTWSFGDDSSGEGAEVTHVFNAAGNYTITLIVDNCAGIPVSVSYVITVEPPLFKVYLAYIVRE
jgi:subtilisin family serine protease/PKD repeat protein